MFSVTLENLQNLQSLDLCNNQITEIPVTLGNLGNLQGLALSTNRIAKKYRSNWVNYQIYKHLIYAITK